MNSVVPLPPEKEPREEPKEEPKEEPEEEQEVILTNSERLNKAGDHFRQLALELIRQRKKKGNQQEGEEAFIKLLDLAQDICNVLRGCQLPLGASIGVEVVDKLLKQLNATLLLKPAVNALILDVVMVMEIVVRADKGIDDELMEKAAGVVHWSLLELAMGEATDLIKGIKEKRWLAKFCCARGLTEQLMAATTELRRARESFCDAVVTGKALGEYVAESVAKAKGEQDGTLPPNGTILLQGKGGTARQYARDVELDALLQPAVSAQPAGAAPNTAGNGAAAGATGGAVGGRPVHVPVERMLEMRVTCMALTGKLQPCSRDATQVFWVKVQGDERAALCVCKQHGTGYRDDGFLVTRLDPDTWKQLYPTPVPRNLPDLRDEYYELRANGDEKHFKQGRKEFNWNLLLPKDILSRYAEYGGEGMKKLVSKLQDEAGCNAAYKCAGVKEDCTQCTYNPSWRFAWAPDRCDTVRLLCTCGTHAIKAKSKEWIPIFDVKDQGSAIAAQNLEKVLQ